MNETASPTTDDPSGACTSPLTCECGDDALTATIAVAATQTQAPTESLIYVLDPLPRPAPSAAVAAWVQQQRLSTGPPPDLFLLHQSFLL